MEAGIEKKRGRGRPRKDEKRTNAELLKAFRKRRDKECWRHDVYISYSAHHRIKRLATEWGCTPAKAIERLIMEADEKYQEILFHDAPEQDILSHDDKGVDFSIFDEEG